jgi:predicted RNase H-like HicB family nuclease
MKYEIDIYWSHLDNCFLAEVPELPGLMADGRTYEEALAMAQEVIEVWLEAAAEAGETIPQPRQRALSA